MCIQIDRSAYIRFSFPAYCFINRSIHFLKLIIMTTILSERKDIQQSATLQFEIVDYSEKAIALFGDTKEIKDLLKAMGGKFNPRLTYNGDKKGRLDIRTDKAWRINYNHQLKISNTFFCFPL
jgi:hypothetical protein